MKPLYVILGVCALLLTASCGVKRDLEMPGKDDQKQEQKAPPAPGAI